MKLLSKKQKQIATGFIIWCASLAGFLFLLTMDEWGLLRGQEGEESEREPFADGGNDEVVVLKTAFRDLGIHTSFRSANSSAGASSTDALRKCLESGVRFLDFELVYAIQKDGNYGVVIGNNPSYYDWADVRGTLSLKSVLATIVEFLHIDDGAAMRSPLLIHLRLKPTTESVRMTAFLNDIYGAIETPAESATVSLLDHLVPPDSLANGLKLADMRPSDLVKSDQSVHLVLDTTTPVPTDPNIEDNVKRAYEQYLETCALHDLCAFTSAHVNDPRLLAEDQGLDPYRDQDIVIYPYYTITVDLSANALDASGQDVSDQDVSGQDLLPLSAATPAALGHIKMLLPASEESDPSGGGWFSGSSSNTNVFYAAKHFSVQCSAQKHFVSDEPLAAAKRVFAANGNATGFVLLDTLRDSTLAGKRSIAKKLDTTRLAVYIAVALFVVIFCAILFFR